MSLPFGVLHTTLRSGAIIAAAALALGCRKPSCTEPSLGDIKAEELAPILQRKAKALLDTANASDPHQVDGPLFDLLPVPAKAEEWFKAMFDAPLGAALAAEWNDDVGRKYGDLLPSFRQAQRAGQTDVRVSFVCKATAADATATQKAALDAMTQPAGLYTVDLVRPGETTGITVGSFAIVERQFAIVGKMTKASGTTGDAPSADSATPAPPPSAALPSAPPPQNPSPAVNPVEPVAVNTPQWESPQTQTPPIQSPVVSSPVIRSPTPTPRVAPARPPPPVRRPAKRR